VWWTDGRSRTDRQQQCGVTLLGARWKLIMYGAIRQSVAYQLPVNYLQQPCLHLAPYRGSNHRGWAKNLTILKVLNFCMWWRRQAFYISKCLVLYPEWNFEYYHIIIFLHNFKDTLLHWKYQLIKTWGSVIVHNSQSMQIMNNCKWRRIQQIYYIITIASLFSSLICFMFLMCS